MAEGVESLFSGRCSVSFLGDKEEREKREARGAKKDATPLRSVGLLKVQRDTASGKAWMQVNGQTV